MLPPVPVPGNAVTNLLQDRLGIAARALKIALTMNDFETTSR